MPSLRQTGKAAYQEARRHFGVRVLLDCRALTPAREPILTIPGAMTALLAVLAVVHLSRMLLPTDLGEWVIWAFGFVPARYDLPLSDGRFPGGAGAAVWSFLTYSLLHADFNHILFNGLWMLPFGSAVARRFGAARFFAFLAVTAVAGAAAHLATHVHEVAPMIGASAAVSGAMAASIRFAFGRGSFLAFGRPRDADSAAQVPALPLSQALRNPRVLAFLGVWFGINIVFGMGSIAIGAPAQSIAWQAHIGGFLAGLVLFSLFDPIAAVPAGTEGAPSADSFDAGGTLPRPPDDPA
jgi:membrane associated rhomboid family serine protease